MHTELRQKNFDPYEELQQFQRTLANAQYGACVNFIGSMRDFNDDRHVNEMYLEHYPGMTEKFLQTIAKEAATKWDILDCLIIHRTGQISPNDSIVLTAVWSAHRSEAFEACRYLIEELKHRAPFWKKESGRQGNHWVDQNTPA